MSTVWIKVCGVTSEADAVSAADLGVDAIGINLIPSSRRYVQPDVARAIARALRGRVETVGVIADQEPRAAADLLAFTQLDWLQLHGSEAPEWLEALLPRAFKALRIAGREDVAQAGQFAGERLLVDAKVEGHLGGTGHAFDWSLVRELATRRSLVLAGGLHPDNVAEAVAFVRPWGVDVASGVERAGDPRRKDPERVARFVAAVRQAAP